MLIKENQISQVKECSFLLSIRRYKYLGSLNSFLSYESQLSSTSILHFHISQPSIHREWQQLYCGIVFPLGGLPVSAIHIWKPRIMDGSNILIYSYGRRYSISHSKESYQCVEDLSHTLQVVIRILLPSSKSQKFLTTLLSSVYTLRLLIGRTSESSCRKQE